MRPPAVALASSLFALLATVLTSFAAPASAGPTVAAAAPASDVPRAVDPGVLADPNIDRGILFPTAHTQPARSLTITDYEIFILGLTYGITDRLQIGAARLLLPGTDWSTVQLGMASVKYQLLRKGGIRVAALGAMGLSQSAEGHDLHVPAGHTDPRPPHRRLSPLVGVVGSACLDYECHSMVSLNLHAFRADLGRGTTTWGVYSGSLVGALGRRLKLIVEYSSQRDLAAMADGTPALISAALRAHGSRFAFEAGVLTGVDEGEVGAGLLYVSASLRLGGR